jgi:hypothetical protein
VYEPSALVRHRHEYAQLRVQITDFGVGFYAYLVRSAIAYPRQQFAIAFLGCGGYGGGISGVCCSALCTHGRWRAP